jgi:hypothetical protein
LVTTNLKFESLNTCDCLSYSQTAAFISSHLILLAIS